MVGKGAYFFEPYHHLSKFIGMPAVMNLVEANCELGVWYIEEDAETLISMLQLNEKEKHYLGQLKHSKRYLLWLSSRVLLRQLLNTTDFIELESDIKRKPLLKNFPHQVSISHSHEMAAVIISEHSQVGIDIERVDAKVKRIEPKFLSDFERAHVDRDQEIRQLIALWCAKEALFKLYGKGSVDFREDLAIEPPFTTEGVLTAEIRKEETLQCAVHVSQVDAYCLAHVAV